jgi:hypothetical protein
MSRNAASRTTVQVHARGACYEAQLTEIAKQDPDRFKAR